MVTVRHRDDRGVSRYDWLDSRHTFSFDHYYDPRYMGFRSLRVINEDRVAPGAGFPTHGHRDMEILSYVLDGALEHKDSTGTGSTIASGDVQRMSAGTGVSHSEYNHSKTAPVHFLQIWILPEREGIQPGYEQRLFTAEEKRGRLRLIAAREGRDGAVTIHQDVSLFAAMLEPGERVTHSIQPGRHAWVQVARGAMALNGHQLVAGDGAAVSNEQRLEIEGGEPAELLLFDLA
jgi:redox-sensitive bicupin YhaK (pirin superfamily)